MFLRLLAAVVAGDAVGRALNEERERRMMEEIISREVDARLAARAGVARPDAADQPISRPA